MTQRYSSEFIEKLHRQVELVNDDANSAVVAELQLESRAARGKEDGHWWRIVLRSSDPKAPLEVRITEWFESPDYVMLDLLLPDELMQAQYAVAMPTKTADESGLLDTTLQVVTAISVGSLGIAISGDKVTAALCTRDDRVYSFYPLMEYSHGESVDTALFLTARQWSDSTFPRIGLIKGSSRELSRVQSVDIQLSSDSRDVKLPQSVPMPTIPGSLLCDLSSIVG